jgi:four helix bundle protein
MAYAFENMKAWQEARNLVVEVYRLLDSFPKFENYALCDQIRRAIISVPSNLAEGSGRISTKEQLHFYEIA